MEQVVDELASGRLLLPYDETLGVLVSVGEGVHGLFDDGQDAGPDPPRRVGRAAGHEVVADQDPPSVARCGGPCAQLAAGVELVPGQAAAGWGGIRQDLGVAVEELSGVVVRGHLRRRQGVRTAQAVDKMTVISTDGAGRNPRVVADNVAQGLELLRSTTGVDLAELLKGITRPSDAGHPESAAANGKVEITG